MAKHDSPNNPQSHPDKPILYHLLMGIGFLALIGWFYLMRELNFMTWLSALGPASHTGAMNMLAIMLWMLPAFLCWKYYLRFINRKLRIGGFFYEDHYYKTPEAEQPQDSESEQPSEPTPPHDNR